MPHARSLVRIDPLDEAAGVTLVRSLMRCGRRAEAEEHCESIALLLDRTGLPRAPLLPALRAELATLKDVAPPKAALAAPAALISPDAAAAEEVRFVGRARELSELLDAHAAASAARKPALVLVTGEPGIGKSRLAEAIRRLRHDGKTVLQASAFEADRASPFLPWMELLRGMEPSSLEDGTRRELSPLLSPEAADAAASDRERLFRAVARLLRDAPIVAFDDAQWLDDASSALLHHVLRALSDQPFVCVLSARRGELADNPSLVGLIRGARRDRVLSEIELGPLSEDEVRELARQARAALDPQRIVRQSQGSPLVALELARWSGGRGDELPGTLREIVTDRLERLPRPALEAVQWAAALGSHFAVDVLGELTGQSADELLRCLELLERHAFLRPAAGSTGEYVFLHELVERAIYLGISEPRRKLMHRRIAALLSASGREEAIANDVARRDGDRASEVEAFSQLVEIVYESGDLERAARESEELCQLAERVREGSEAALARGLWAVIRCARGDTEAARVLDDAIAELRAKDAMHRLAKILIYAAELDLAAGDPTRARSRAEEAAELAEALERQSDRVVARALAARASLELERDTARAHDLLESMGRSPCSSLSARAESALALLVAQIDDFTRTEETFV